MSTNTKTKANNANPVIGALSLTCGLVSLFIYGDLLGVAALILGVAGIVTKSGKGMAIAGFVIGVLGILISVAYAILMGLAAQQGIH